MQEFNLAQFIILTVLQYLGIALYFFFINRIKVYSRQISRNDMSLVDKLKRAEKLMFYSHLFIVIIMIVKTNYENKVKFSDICEPLWFIDVVFMAIFTLSFVWRIYKYGWG